MIEGRLARTAVRIDENNRSGWWSGDRAGETDESREAKRGCVRRNSRQEALPAPKDRTGLERTILLATSVVGVIGGLFAAINGLSDSFRKFIGIFAGWIVQQKA